MLAQPRHLLLTAFANAMAAVVAVSPVHAEEPAPVVSGDRAAVGAPARTNVDAFVWSTSPLALGTGMVLGGGADARLPVGARGLFLGARLAAGTTTEYTADWELNHLHGLATLDAGLERRLGAGLLRAELGLGGLLVVQRGQRHQYDRLRAAGIDELRRDGWSAGPYASLEVGAAVVFYAPWRLFVQLGPAFTLQQIAGETRGRWLFSSGLGVGRAF